jgi:two-component system chemotaxis response regulator CheB
MGSAIRVLIADDSPVARAMLRDMFESDAGFDVIAEADNGREAVRLVQLHRPDLVTMDLEMPEMDGIEAISEIMGSRPVPILVVSSFADAKNAFAAASCGAVDVIAKPDVSDSDIARFLDKARLVASIRVITHIRALRAPRSAPMTTAPIPVEVSATVRNPRRKMVFAVASSTGGPQALARIFSSLPPDFGSPILVAQHVAPGFSAGMADWLATVSRLPVKLARHDDAVVPGIIYLSPSEAHATLTPTGRIALSDTRETDIYRPSCNALLESVAATCGRRGIGVILTGMGSDGVKGMTKIAEAGGTTLAQDQASSVVFGMNRAAIDAGCVSRILPLDTIAEEMARLSGVGD